MYIGPDEQPGEAGAGICTPAGLLTPPIPTSSHLAIVAGMPSQSQHIRSLTVTVWVQDTVPRDHPDPSTSSGDGPGEGAAVRRLLTAGTAGLLHVPCIYRACPHGVNTSNPCLGQRPVRVLTVECGP